MLDDASDPTTAGRNARKLVVEDKVDVLIGTSGVPRRDGHRGSGARAQHAADLAHAGHHPRPEGAWTVTVSQPFPLMVAAVVERMKKSGVEDGRLHRLLRCAGATWPTTRS